MRYSSSALAYLSLPGFTVVPSPGSFNYIENLLMISKLLTLSLQVNKVLESSFLAFIAVYIILKLTWFGPRQFITSKASVFNVSSYN